MSLRKVTSRQVIHAAIVGDILVAATKFGAALWTGSAAMLSEAVHSLVDTINALLLLYGLRQGEVPPDADHPLGHGREIYFWSFVVSVAIFTTGACVSLYQGLTSLLHAAPIHDVAVNYVVLALSAAFEGTTWLFALRSFKSAIGTSGILEAVVESKDPPAFMVIFEDGAALIGILIAFLGTYLSVRLNIPSLDGVASVLIGFVLATSAAMLWRETKGLLIGEPAERHIVASILQLAASTRGVAHANGIITMHLAPTQIVVALSLEFADDLRTTDIELTVAELERRLRLLHPEVIAMFVKPQSEKGYHASHNNRHTEASHRYDGLGLLTIIPAAPCPTQQRP